MGRIAAWMLASAGLLGSFSAGAEPAPDLNELWRMVQQQQASIAELNQKLDAALATTNQTQLKLRGAEAELAANRQKIEATADVLEMQPAQARPVAASWAARSNFGGYGELHYNNLDDDATSADGVTEDLNRTDFHRFVLFFNHEFTDWLRFGSELEVEHVVVSSDSDDPGEVELEQAWLEIDLPFRQRLRTGLDLVPVGILNPTHEPNTFYGVERNPIEHEIIPATWWEAGAALAGEMHPGLSYDLVLHTGLVIPTAGAEAFQPGAGRTEIAEADDQDVAFTGRLRYTAIAGLELALSGQYQADYTGSGDSARASAYLLEGHLDYRHQSGLGLRALYARWEFGADRGQGPDPGARGADTLSGWYVEPAYRFSPRGVIPGEAGLFTRYSRWDQADGLGLLFQEYERFDIGMNYWPVPQVVFKIDAQWEASGAAVANEFDGFNLGFGYQF